MNVPGYSCNIGTNSVNSGDIETAVTSALGAGWCRLDKTDDATVSNNAWPNPLPLVPAENANSGTWQLADGLWGSFEGLVLILKDGNFDPNGKDAPPPPIKWVWYEIKPGDYAGDWFLGNVINCQGEGSCAKNLSHGELFGYGYRQVPEPGTLGLLGLGLLALVRARWPRGSGTSHNTALALSLSNGTALLILFVGGFSVGKYSGFRPAVSGVGYSFTRSYFSRLNNCTWRLRMIFKFSALYLIMFFVPLLYSQEEDTNAATEWEFSAEADLYFADPFIFLTIFSANREKLHLEARYNYEDLKTFSGWIGYNFYGGEEFEYFITPMIGGVVGRTNEIAPGLEFTLSIRGFELYSESEYLFDLESEENNFFYSWTDLTYSPLDWLWFGISGQRTGLYQTELEIQHGLLLGGSYENWHLPVIFIIHFLMILF